MSNSAQHSEQVKENILKNIPLHFQPVRICVLLLELVEQDVKVPVSYALVAPEEDQRRVEEEEEVQRRGDG